MSIEEIANHHRHLQQQTKKKKINNQIENKIFKFCKR